MKVERAGVTVVLVSYNTRELTLDCLRSLTPELNSTQDAIVVVDNASHDGSVDAIRTEFPSIQLIENGVNVGFGAANNIAFAQCQTPFVWLLNTDTLVRSGALLAMFKAIESRPQIGAVGCRLENKDGSLQRSCWSFPSPIRAWGEAFGLNRVGLLRDWHRWPHDTEEAVDFVIGAALLVRKEVIQTVGGFDEDFFLYAEEADWQKRMTANGWQICFTPQGTVVHLGGASGASMPDRQLVDNCRGTARYIRKHHGQGGVLCFRAGVIVGLMVRLIIMAALSLIRRDSNDRFFQLQRILKCWLGMGPQAGFQDLGRQS